MISRDDLKSIIDRVPQDHLGDVFSLLNFLVNPPKPNPELERMRQRTEQYREVVQRRVRDTGKRGKIGGDVPIGGAGSSGVHEGVRYERHGFDYWDEGALVERVFQSFDGEEIEIMERFLISPDRKKLFCNLELSSGGHTVQHADEFPVSPSTKRSDGR